MTDNKKKKNKYWIVEIRDDARLGHREGEISEKTIEGPFKSPDEAMIVKLNKYPSSPSVYYALRQNPKKPSKFIKMYSFEKGEFNED